MAQKDSDLDLMMYADGELSGAAAEEARARLKTDPRGRDVVDGLNELGEVVRTRLEMAADRAAEQGKFERVWAEIERATQQAPERAPARVPVQAPAGGWGARWSAWWEQFHGHVLTGAATFAAVLLFVIATRPFERVVEKTVHTQVPVAPVMQVAQPPEIENLEIYQGTGMVLTVQGEAGDAPTAVIWLNSKEDIAEGPL